MLYYKPLDFQPALTMTGKKLISWSLIYDVLSTATQAWKQLMIKTKKEFDRLLAESEQAFQAYIFCPSEENEERYQTLKYQYREQVLESDLRLIIKWSK